MGVVRPCPPVRNDIVTPRHLFSASFMRDAVRSFGKSNGTTQWRLRNAFKLSNLNCKHLNFLDIQLVFIELQCYDLVFHPVKKHLLIQIRVHESSMDVQSKRVSCHGWSISMSMG